MKLIFSKYHLLLQNKIKVKTKSLHSTEIALTWVSHLQAFFPGEPPSTFPSFTAITRSINHIPQGSKCGFLLLSVLTWVEAIRLCCFFLESPLLAASLNPLLAGYWSWQ